MPRLCRDPGPLDGRCVLLRSGPSTCSANCYSNSGHQPAPPPVPGPPIPPPHHHRRRGPGHCLDPCASAAVASISSGTPAQRQAERNDQRRDDRVMRANRGLVRLGQDGLELLSTDCCRLMSRSGRSRGAPNRLGVAELADLERPHDVDGARHHRPDADEHEQCVGARQEELPAHPEAQRHHEDATDQGQPP